MSRPHLEIFPQSALGQQHNEATNGSKADKTEKDEKGLSLINKIDHYP